VFACAAWWSVLPALSPLHLAFSSHQDRFEPLFQRFEDILVKNGTPADEAKRYPTRPGVGSSGNKACEVIIVPCTVSNSFLNRSAAISFLNTTSSGHLPAELFVGCGQDSIYTLSSVLANAPKQSPPLAS